MGFQPGANLYTAGFGSRPENVEVPHIDTRAPAASDVNYPVGKPWINQSANAAYVLTSLTSLNGTVTANWQSTAGATSAIASINNNAPVAGNYTLAGTTNQIAVAQSSGTTTFSIPTSPSVAGTLTAATGLTATTGNITASAGSVSANTTVTAGTGITATTGAITASNGNLVLGSAGNKISVATGANASAGTSGAMTAGVVTVNTTAVTANSLIFAMPATLGTVTVPSSVYVSAITAGTSFTLTSSAATDTSTWNWWLIN